MPWERSQKHRSIYEQVKPEEFDQFLNGLKRRLFFSSLKMIYTFHSKAWAKTSVGTTIKKVYLEKEKFSPSEQEEMENMIS